MKTPATYYRLAVGVALGTVLFLILAIGALGIIGDGGRPDRIYLGVLGTLAIGSLAARLRPRGMVLALLATAFAQILVTVTALLGDLHGDASVTDILGINTMYAALFGLSAWLFRRAAEQRAPATVDSPV